MKIFCQMLAASLLALTAIGCDPSDPCDPGTHDVDGNCLPNKAAGGAKKKDAGSSSGAADASTSSGDASSSDDATAADGGGSAKPAGSCSTAAGDYTVFGTSCSSDKDCMCPAPTCAPVGNYCTHLNCKTDASLCPPMWTCFDLSFLGDPKQNSACAKP